MKRFILFIIIFLTACTQNPPKWYEKIYNDNSYFIYATGEGTTKKEAINSALANASSKVAVVVKSIYNSLKYSYKGDDTSAYSNTSLFNIQTKTNPLTFIDYKILKLEKRDKYYVLIKIDRIKNATYMCNNIDIPKINNKLDIFLHYKSIIKSLNKTIEKLKTINALAPICKEKLQKTINIKNKITKIHNNLSYSIISNDNKLKNILSSILDFKNLHPKIKIILNAKTKYTKIGDYKISTIYLNISIKNKTDSKNFYLICAASSIDDYKTAKELAYKECKEKLKKIFN